MNDNDNDIDNNRRKISIDKLSNKSEQLNENSRDNSFKDLRNQTNIISTNLKSNDNNNNNISTDPKEIINDANIDKLQYNNDDNLCLNSSNNKNSNTIIKSPSKNDYEDGVENNDSLIINYESDKPVYSMSFQTSDTQRIALGSLDLSLENKIEILRMKKDKLYLEANLFHEFPISKLMWCPHMQSNSVFGASSDLLRIYKYNEEDNIIENKINLFNKKSKYSDPLTSFDWNRVNDSIIGTSSLDTTCTIWDLNKETIKFQLIAHDKQVLDIAFGQDENTFISAGADGSIRLFDMRSLEHSTILYECKDYCPIIKLSWNRQNIDQIASISLQRNTVQIINACSNEKVRRELKSHSENVNAMAWAPHTNSHLCTVGEDGFAYIWDLQNLEDKDGFTQPFLQYNAQEPIKNVCWSEFNNKWIGITYKKTMRLLKL